MNDKEDEAKSIKKIEQFSSIMLIIRYNYVLCIQLYIQL